jgi:hypothetical protein
MRPTQPDRITSPEPVEHRRSAVVDTHDQTRPLTAQGVSATTFDDVLGQPDEAVLGYFAGNEPAVLWQTSRNGRKVEATAARLGRLRIAMTIRSTVRRR